MILGRCAILSLLIFTGFSVHGLADEPVAPGGRASFVWQKLPDLPPGVTAQAGLMGVTNGAMVVLGGQSDKGMADAAYVLGSEQEMSWQIAGALPHPLGGGTAVSTPRGIVILSGKDAGDASNATFIISWDPTAKSTHFSELPPVPLASSRTLAAAVGTTLYALLQPADGSHARFFSLGLIDSADGWQTLGLWNDGSLRPAAMVVQSNGERPCLFVFANDASGRGRAMRYEPGSRTWRELLAAPSNLAGSSAVASGQSHILLFRPDTNEALVYHTITDSWTARDDVSGSLWFTHAFKWGTRFVGVMPTERGTGEFGTALYIAKAPERKSRFGLIDYLALLAYPVLLIAMGLYFTVDEKTTDKYFRGGQRIPAWAAGLSLVATQVSAIGFMAIPAKAFATNWVYFVGILGWFIVVPIVNRVYIPLFRRLNVTTAYEYLEARFSFAMRLFGSVLFMVIQLTRAAVVLYLPALALSSVTGIDKIWCVLGMGIVTTVYTVMGGMQAVIWTDVIQAVMLLGGALLCVVLVIISAGGVSTFADIALGDGKFQMVDAGWDIAGPALWVVIIGSVFARLSTLTADQNIVQRYQTTANLRDARRALWIDAAVSIPWAIIIFLLGTALYVFFKLNPAAMDPTMETDQVVPLFIAERVPMGLAGLIVAAIFAASLDGSMLSVATTFVNDVYGRLSKSATERRRVILARLATVVLGAFATFIAVLLASSNVKSLWDFAIQVSGLFAGSFAGIFVLGLFTRRVGTAAAFVGTFSSAAVMYFVEMGNVVHLLLYAGVGVTTCVVIGYLASLFLPPPRQNLAGLTYFTASPRGQAGLRDAWTPSTGTA